MCSTTQSPRAPNAFSRACAARRCPAPEDADKSSTRGLLFMHSAWFWGSTWKSVLGLANSELFKDAARDALQFAKTGQVVLKFGVHELRFLRTELYTQDHVAELDGMRKESVFLEFFESSFGVVVIHSSSERSAGADGEKLVTLNLGRYAHGAVCADFDAHDLAATANINLARLGNFLR